jgi:hypothetical protein
MPASGEVVDVFEEELDPQAVANSADRAQTPKPMERRKLMRASVPQRSCRRGHGLLATEPPAKL